MKLKVNENRDIELSELFNGIALKSTDGEHFGICMRDGGFEFNYAGVWYEAKAGKINELDKLEDWVSPPTDGSGVPDATCGCGCGCDDINVAKWTGTNPPIINGGIEDDCGCAQPDHCDDNKLD